MPTSTRDDEVHMSVYPSPSMLGRHSRTKRKAMLQLKKGVHPVSVYVLAVIELQRLWRGILLRRRVVRKYGGQQGLSEFKRLWRGEEAQLVYRYQCIPRPMESQFVNLARRVQARWRTVLLKSEFSRWGAFSQWPIYYVAAATIQRAFVDYRYVKRQRQHRNRSKRFYSTKEDAAAAKIQIVYRSYVNKSMYLFYRQLIKFRESGDPLLMLKAINPNESDLVDRAAGLHVRFRLAGSSFPPFVVYKIFTHNNIADVCSFAPKDYCNRQRRKDPSLVNNKEPTRRAIHQGVVPKKGRNGKPDRSGWYRRVENNPWRPISDSMLTDAERIAAQYDSRFAPRTASNVDIITPAAPFHYSRLKRRQERDVKDKQRRRKWLAQLYASEQIDLMKGRIPADTIKDEANAMFFEMEENEVDDEVDRLVSWTEHLDYSKYRTDWLCCASTAASDTLIPSVQQTREKLTTTHWGAMSSGN